MGSSNTIHSSLMMFTICLVPIMSIFVKENIARWNKTNIEGRCYQHNLGYQTSLAFLSLWSCSTTLGEWYAARFGCSVGTSMVPLLISDTDVSWGENNIGWEVPVRKSTIVRHLSVSALHLREVFRIRSRKVMISEIRLNVIYQRMGNFRSKSTNQGSSNEDESVFYSVADARKMGKWCCFHLSPDVPQLWFVLVLPSKFGF